MATVYRRGAESEEDRQKAYNLEQVGERVREGGKRKGGERREWTMSQLI